MRESKSGFRNDEQRKTTRIRQYPMAHEVNTPARISQLNFAPRSRSSSLTFMNTLISQPPDIYPELYFVWKDFSVQGRSECCFNAAFRPPSLRTSLLRQTDTPWYILNTIHGGVKPNTQKQILGSIISHHRMLHGRICLNKWSSGYSACLEYECRWFDPLVGSYEDTLNDGTCFTLPSTRHNGMKQKLVGLATVHRVWMGNCCPNVKTRPRGKSVSVRQVLGQGRVSTVGQPRGLSARTWNTDRRGSYVLSRHSKYFVPHIFADRRHCCNIAACGLNNKQLYCFNVCRGPFILCFWNGIIHLLLCW